MGMQEVKERIAKLLALAGNNPSENEAKAALLKARMLMAEHKLRPEECEVLREQKVVKSLIGVSCTGRTDTWAVNLSAIIAAHYCCIAWRRHTKGTMTQHIGFCGLEDDFEICSRIYRCAFDFVSSESKRIFKENARRISADARRRAAEAYGWGFCVGLQEALKTQQEEHQEWGLVMVVPKEVNEACPGPKTPYGKMKLEDDASVRAGQKGYADGVKFDPSTKLEEAKAPAAICG